MPPMLRAIGRVTGCNRSTIELEGLTAPVGSLVAIAASGGEIPAEVVGVKARGLVATPLSDSGDITPGAPVRVRPSDGATPHGKHLLGRIVDALGNPIDGGRSMPVSGGWRLTGRSCDFRNRGRVLTRFHTGVRAIDTLLAMGRGQRTLLIAPAGVGKTTLLQQIMNGSDADAVVFGLIGERRREVADLAEHVRCGPAADKTAMVVATADEPPQLRLRALQRATAIAESLSADGKSVLLLVDSLSRVVHAQREIALAMGEPAAARGYPPSALALIPRLLERVGVDATGGGSITAIYTVLTDGEARDDPVAEAARSISDGHIVLSRELADQAIFPAIDAAASLSRVMDDVVSVEQASLARQFRHLLALHKDNRDLLMIGAYASGTDSDLDRAIALRQPMLDLIKQRSNVAADFENSICQLKSIFERGHPDA